MAHPDSLERIKCLYHFTDYRNLPSIRRLGGLFPMAILRQIGPVVAAPGGNTWSHDADQREGLDQYVHLCFLSQHPMEYIARQDGRIESSIFLEIKSEILKLPGVLVTLDVSNKAGVERLSLSEANSLIDFEVLYGRTD